MSACGNCGGAVAPSLHGRKKLYCGDRCRNTAEARRARVRNPELFAARMRAHHLKHAVRRNAYTRNNNLQTKFGITVTQYEALNTAQGGVCAICAQQCNSGRRLAVDHCHDTGSIRQLLCGNCNHGLGKFKDSPDLLRLAAGYIEYHASLPIPHYQRAELAAHGVLQ